MSEKNYFVIQGKLLLLIVLSTLLFGLTGCNDLEQDDINAELNFPRGIKELFVLDEQIQSYVAVSGGLKIIRITVPDTSGYGQIIIMSKEGVVEAKFKYPRKNVKKDPSTNGGTEFHIKLLAKDADTQRLQDFDIMGSYVTNTLGVMSLNKDVKPGASNTSNSSGEFCGESWKVGYYRKIYSINFYYGDVRLANAANSPGKIYKKVETLNEGECKPRVINIKNSKLLN